jgi:histone-lysine N-methyltransferase SETMAR
MVYKLLLLFGFTPSSSTINVTDYQETLNRLKKVIWHDRLGLLTKEVLLNNNAQVHSAAATVYLLNYSGWEILPHPPTSPDLAPSDFHLLPKMKKHLTV